MLAGVLRSEMQRVTSSSFKSVCIDDLRNVFVTTDSRDKTEEPHSEMSDLMVD